MGEAVTRRTRFWKIAEVLADEFVTRVYLAERDGKLPDE